MLVVLTNIPTPYRTAFFNVLKEKLAKQNIGFHVLYMAKTEPRRFWEFHADENQYEYTFLKGFHPTFKSFYPHFNPSVVAQVKKLKPTWILLAGSWNAPSVIQILMSKNSLEAKTIFWSEGHLDAQRSMSYIIDRLRGFIHRSIDAFVVPNSKSRDYIKLYSNKAPIGMLPNTIDENFFNSDETDSKEKLRLKFKIPSDKKVLLSVATLSDRKGIMEMVEAYHILPVSQREQIILVLAGTGELAERIQKFKDEHQLGGLYLVGQLSPEQVREYMQMADFFILPTKLDPNPLTPIEACFMKTPIILSRKAGNHEELLIADTGFSIDEITPEKIKVQLLKVLDITPQQIEEMGEAAYMNVRDRFSRESAAEGLIAFIRTL